MNRMYIKYGYSILDDYETTLKRAISFTYTFLRQYSDIGINEIRFDDFSEKRIINLKNKDIIYLKGFVINVKCKEFHLICLNPKNNKEEIIDVINVEEKTFFHLITYILEDCKYNLNKS